MSFRFRRFQVYKDAKTLHIEIVQTVSIWGGKYFYLSDQIKRSSLSIMLNIAEGSSKQSDKDFNRFISIALGSVDETIAILEIAVEYKLIDNAKFGKFEKSLESISKQLGGLSKTLKNKLQ